MTCPECVRTLTAVGASFKLAVVLKLCLWLKREPRQQTGATAL